MSVVDLEIESDYAFVTFLGKRQWGKSHAARLYFDAYPFDRVVFDPNNDIAPEADWITIRRVPEDLATTGLEKREEALPLTSGTDPARVTVHYVPILSDPHWREDLDRLLLAVFEHQWVCLWIDEVVKVAKANQTLPSMDLILHQFAHQHLVVLLCGPRPVDIDPLVITQADLLYLYRLRGVQDRRRLAELLGVDLSELDVLMTLEPYNFLLHRDAFDDLVLMPPLPA